jgi:catechol 2,3-dioxygenase-like lactoylglutathione lyase family enzyme
MKEKIFNHVAVTINDLSEIKDFYVNILGLEIIRKFTLSKDISNKIFNIEKETEVTVLGKGDFSMEIFKSDKTSHNDFQHVCITVNNRVKVIQKARENNYPCIIIKRDTSDAVFIRDKSNNLFEIKQSTV